MKLPVNTPVPVFERLYLNLTSSVELPFHFEAPITSMTVQGWLEGVTGTDVTYQIYESMDDNHWTNITGNYPTGTVVPWEERYTFDTLGLGRFKAHMTNDAFVGTNYYHLWVIGHTD